MGMHTTCVLPGGVWDASGVLHREVELTPLTGREEELLADRSVGPAVLVTRLLSRCVRRLGGLGPLSEDSARELRVGDRQYLLIKLRQLTFGDKVEMVVRCPWPDCGEASDIDFSISDVPVRDAGASAWLSEVELSPEAAESSGFGLERLRVCFRLPTGADQELLSPALAHNEAQALSALLARCVQSIGEEAASPELVARLSPSARRELERAMESATPGFDLTMEAKCSECGRAFAAPFDAQDFLLGEARGSRDLLMREIHYLAYHYHWSETDILAMSRDRRRGYIEILADEIERLNDAAAN
jgi:hypothetical protein